MVGRAEALLIEPALCTGCRQCELACSWVQTGCFAPAKSMIRVHAFDEQASFAPYVCLQCDEAWCMQVCPVNAIDVDERSGAKIVLDEVCAGCKLCVIACPFGTIFFDKGGDVAAKCDMCAGDPACAHACPTGAIVVARVDSGAWLANLGQSVDAAYRAAVDGEGAP